jgi:Family of unknown function (DUF6567)
MKKVLLLLLPLVLTGCAAMPLDLMSEVSGGGLREASPFHLHDETSVQLSKDNFAVVKANVSGRCQGFKLLGFITIVPAPVNKAMDRMYAAAALAPGRPQAIANVMFERTSGYFVLFSIPKVEVRANVVEFQEKS